MPPIKLFALLSPSIIVLANAFADSESVLFNPYELCHASTEIFSIDLKLVFSAIHASTEIFSIDLKLVFSAIGDGAEGFLGS